MLFQIVIKYLFSNLNKNKTITKKGSENPPNYFTIELVNNLRSAKNESTNQVQLTHRTLSVMFSSIIFTIFLTLTSVISISMLIIGKNY